MRKSARGAPKLNQVCSAKQISMTKILYELTPPLYPSLSPALSSRSFTTSMASISRGLKLKMFCMYAEEARPVLLWPAVLRVMSNLMRKGEFSCSSWLQSLNCDSGWASQTKGSTISFITGIFAVKMASLQVTHPNSLSSWAKSLRKNSSIATGTCGVSKRSMSEFGRLTPEARDPKMFTEKQGSLTPKQESRRWQEAFLSYQIYLFSLSRLCSLFSNNFLKIFDAACYVSFSKPIVSVEKLGFSSYRFLPLRPCFLFCWEKGALEMYSDSGAFSLLVELDPFRWFYCLWVGGTKQSMNMSTGFGDLDRCSGLAGVILPFQCSLILQALESTMEPIGWFSSGFIETAGGSMVQICYYFFFLACSAFLQLRLARLDGFTGVGFSKFSINCLASSSTWAKYFSSRSCPTLMIFSRPPFNAVNTGMLKTDSMDLRERQEVLSAYSFIFLMLARSEGTWAVSHLLAIAFLKQTVSK